jgi:hypothetical protein
MKALEFEEYMVPFFTEAERVQFVRILNNLQPVIKKVEELGEDITYTFEDIPIGDLPDKFKSVLDAGRNPIEGSFVKVSEEADGNRVIELTAKNRGNDQNGRNNSLSFPVERLSNYPNATVLEFDIKVLEDTDKTKAIELCFRGKGGGATIYPMFYPKADGTVEGVKSQYPTTTLMTDTEGVMIEAEYNRDLNKAYQALADAIVALGGAV